MDKIKWEAEGRRSLAPTVEEEEGARSPVFWWLASSVYQDFDSFNSFKIEVSK